MNRSNLELTPQEKKAISALKRLEKKWPDTLWLFSGSGTLCVVKKNEDGEKAMDPIMRENFDQNYIVAQFINIENDGGDW
jgi:hypothetical protein